MSNQNLNRELLVDINNNHIINHFDDYNLEYTVYTKEEAEQIADCGIYIFLN